MEPPKPTRIFSRRSMIYGAAGWLIIAACVGGSIEAIYLFRHSDAQTKTSVVQSFFAIVSTVVAGGLMALAKRVASNRKQAAKEAERLAAEQKLEQEKLAKEAAEAKAQALEQKRRVDVMWERFDLMWSTAMDRGKLVAVDRGFATLNTEPPIMNTYIRLTDAGREMFADMADTLGELYHRLCGEFGRSLKFEELSEQINKHHGREIAEKICTRVDPPMTQYECLVLAATVAIETAFHMPLEQIKRDMPGLVH